MGLFVWLLNFTFSAKFLSCDEIFTFLQNIGHMTNTFTFSEKDWSRDKFSAFLAKKNHDLFAGKAKKKL